MVSEEHVRGNSNRKALFSGDGCDGFGQRDRLEAALPDSVHAARWLWTCGVDARRRVARRLGGCGLL
eukprot:6188442-Pleurochrysis_carterae.AAC.1